MFFNSGEFNDVSYIVFFLHFFPLLISLCPGNYLNIVDVMRKMYPPLYIDRMVNYFEADNTIISAQKCPPLIHIGTYKCVCMVPYIYVGVYTYMYV